MSQLTLLKYNFRIMMLNNRWLVVFPLAVSQLTVFWLILTQRFSPELPTQSVELITPLLGAFLGAHLLSAEYRSRVGALLACRPVNIGRIVVLRLIVVLAVVWALALISLLAYTYGMQLFDMTRPLAACIPSTLFLTMLALTFATLFRHSFSGFAVSALYWAMDLLPGPPIQPYMSLRALTAYYAVYTHPDKQTFLKEWWISKLLLLIGAVVLYVIHSRVVFTLGSAQTARTRRRAIGGAGALLIIYLISGAVLRVGYGYVNRGRLAPNDVGWFRYQFAPYGPLPVAALFGSDFVRFLGEMNNPWRMPEGNEADVVGDTVKHHRSLHELIARSPNSIWAPSAADALARMEARRQGNLEGMVASYRLVVDKYPQSPYVDYALRQAARAYIDAARPSDAEAAYAELVQRRPQSVYATEALRYLVQAGQLAGKWDDAIKWATQWTSSAPIEDRFDAWLALAQMRKARGDEAGSRQAAQAALTAVADFRTALRSETLVLMPSKKNVRMRAANAADQIARGLL